ncbi:Multiple EGF-like-domain protein 3 precursor [Minicystis rosea]|nr:Multiple EGF-like-domain protein 3 precursor [Minicystis rosea]
MEDSCCSEMQACATGTDCDDLLVCANACADGDGTCVDKCITDHSQGYDDYNAMFTCYNGSCKTTAECIYQICDSQSGFADQKCAECLGGATCCTAVKDCDADTDCSTCVSTPTTTGCDTNTKYGAYDTCMTDTCGSVCTFEICGSGLGYSSASCNYCLSQAGNAGCCDSFNACLADTTCKACLGNPAGAGCATNTLFTGFTTCRGTTCATACGN